MKNLTQKQRDAKQSYLDKQLEQMFNRYQKADQTERKAIIRQLDSFLPVTRNKDERIFWIRFRRKLEMLSEKQEK